MSLSVSPKGAKAAGRPLDQNSHSTSSAARDSFSPHVASDWVSIPARTTLARLSTSQTNSATRTLALLANGSLFAARRLYPHLYATSARARLRQWAAPTFARRLGKSLAFKRLFKSAGLAQCIAPLRTYSSALASAASESVNSFRDAKREFLPRV